MLCYKVINARTENIQNVQYFHNHAHLKEYKITRNRSKVCEQIKLNDVKIMGNAINYYRKANAPEDK